MAARILMNDLGAVIAEFRTLRLQARFVIAGMIVNGVRNQPRHF